VIRWVLIALLGLAVAALVSLSASDLTSQPVGLSSEPLTAGDQLAPRTTVTRTITRTATTPRHRHRHTTTTTRPPATITPPVATRPPAATRPTATTGTPPAATTDHHDRHDGDGDDD
jgi:hypothetical protein